MKSLIVCTSVHHGNTEQVARAMARVLNAELVRPEDIEPGRVAEYRLVGFGSGIYFRRFHRRLLQFVDRLPAGRGGRAFVFSTSGLGRRSFNDRLVYKLIGLGFDVLGNFACRGYDTFALLRLVGGIARGHPDAEDLRAAMEFAHKLRHAAE